MIVQCYDSIAERWIVGPNLHCIGTDQYLRSLFPVLPSLWFHPPFESNLKVSLTQVTHQWIHALPIQPNKFSTYTLFISVIKVLV